ncbi:MAG: hypothetical protein HY711_08690 [Candidatus Melainabacteria bacterium]|nr:hypothetical protein [Candidatus Melainabacteria bacterium]
MNNIYMWCVTAMTVLVAINALWRLLGERERLCKENLSDKDRAFVWRIVLFLVFPLLTLLDLRTTIVATEWFGGYCRNWSYGLMWYQAIPEGLSSAKLLIPVLFAGWIAQLLFAVCLLPALLFRPHPFLSTLIGYTIVFVCGLNLIVEPIIASVGLGGPRWQLAQIAGPPGEQLLLCLTIIAGAFVYLYLLENQNIRLWFCGLSRPQVATKLNGVLLELTSGRYSASLSCQAALLYDKAGLGRHASQELKRLRCTKPGSIYSYFLEGVLAYKHRNYKSARIAFLRSSEFPEVDGKLKAGLLAAGACSAFADGDATSALNLSERALEFDDDCLVARMVKVDVFLKQGKKDEAGEEILLAMRRGLELDIEDKIPLDSDEAMVAIATLEENRVQELVASRN